MGGWKTIRSNNINIAGGGCVCGGRSGSRRCLRAGIQGKALRIKLHAIVNVRVGKVIGILKLTQRGDIWMVWNWKTKALGGLPQKGTYRKRVGCNPRIRSRRRCSAAFWEVGCFGVAVAFFHTDFVYFVCHCRAFASRSGILPRDSEKPFQKF